MLRSRPLEEKIAVHLVLQHRLAPLFAEKKLRPVIDCVLDLADADAAHARMKSNAGIGKIVLRV